MKELSNKRASTYENNPWFIDVSFSNWIINNLAPFGKSLCDVGAGTGYMLRFYAELFSPLIAVEPSQQMLNILLKKPLSSVQVIKAGAEDIPLPNKCVDIVIAKSALHHFQNKTRAINEMTRIGQKMIALVEVVAPHPDCLPFLQGILLEKEPYRSVSDIFTESDLETSLSNVAHEVRIMLYDQYIDIDLWLANSELDPTFRSR